MSLCGNLPQVPGEMLRQIRYLYEAEVKHLNPRRVQKALKQMQHMEMGQGISFSRRVHEVSWEGTGYHMLC